MKSAVPTREARLVARRTLLSLSARRQRPGSGSMLHELMGARRPSVNWWRQAVETLSTAGVKVATAGGVAANAYMPPRFTADLDLALRIGDLDRAGQSLRAAGWQFLGPLELYEDLRGTAWKSPAGHELDLIGLPGEWGRTAIEEAQANVVGGLPTLTLAHLVNLKLISSRPQDMSDISRMLGAASDAALARVRAIAGRIRPFDLEDLEQMIVAGKLEFGGESRESGPSSTRCRVCGRPLTSPGSIRAGAGPECAARVDRTDPRHTRPGR